MKQKAKHIAKKTLKYFLEISATLVALAAICVIGLVIRLSQGPIQLDFLKPFVTETIEKSDLGVTIAFEDSVLQWSEKSTSLQLVLSEIAILNENDLKLGEIKRLGFGLSLRALLDGDLRVRDLVIYQPDLYILRNENGEIHLDFQQEKAEGEEKKEIAQDPKKKKRWNIVTILNQLATPYEKAKKPNFLNYLNSISVVDAKMRLLDLSTQQFWRLPKVEFMFAKIEKGFGGELDFDMESNERVMNFKTQLLYKHADKQDQGEIFWKLDVDRFYLSDFIKRFEQLSFLDGTTLPLSLHSDVHLSDGLKVLGFDIRGKADKGDLQITDVLENKIAIKGFEIDAHYDDAKGVGEITKARLTLNDASFDINASWDLNKVENNIVIQSQFGGFSTQELYNVWPLMAAPGARRWAVESVSNGQVKEGQLELAASLNLADKHGDGFEITNFSGGFDYEGLVVKFLPEMPPVTELNGKASFGLDSLDFGIDFAMINDLVIGGGNVKIHNFDYKEHPIELLDINLSPVSGKVANIAHILDQKPLTIISRVGRDVSDFDGTFKGDMFLSFPLDKDLKMEEVSYKGKAHSDDLYLKNVYQDLILDKGVVDITVDTQELVVKGSAQIDGENITGLSLKEDISGKQTPRTQVAFKGNVKADKISKFVPVLKPYIEGKAAIDFDYQDMREKGQKITIKSDLTDASVNLKQLLNFKKEEGRNLKASLDVHLGQDSALKKISSLNVFSDTSVNIGGDIDFDANGGVTKLDFPTFKLENNDFILKGRKHATVNDRLRIDITGSAIDIAGIFENEDDFDLEKNETNSESDGNETAYEISIKTDKAYAVDGTMFEKFNTYILRDKEKSFKVFELDATMPGEDIAENTVRVRYSPKKLAAFTSDAGGLIERLGIYEDVTGGKMYVRLLPKEDNPNIMEGQLLVKELRAIKAPVIARILDALSFEGISTLFDKNKKGLVFNRIASNVIWDKTPKKEMLKLREGKTKSDSLGLTFDGNYYFTTGKTEINGTIVPVSDVNNFLASIPLLGDIITMGAGSSVFAATYSVNKKPTAEDVEVSVNPVAALAPGFLRTLFFEERFDEDTFNDQ